MMKRLLVACALLFSAAFPYEALAVDEPTYLYHATANLNLRTGPSLHNAVITVIPKGTGLEVLGEEQVMDGYTWVRVSAVGEQGWVVSLYIGNYEQPPVQLQTTYALRLRECPSTACATVAILPKHTVVTDLGADHVMADGYTWMLVSTIQGTGWCAKEYVQ